MLYLPSGSAQLSAAFIGIAGIGLAVSQTIHLQGILNDRYSAVPIADAEVTLLGQGLKTRTDNSGRFELKRVPTRLGEGSHSVPFETARISATGLAFRNPVPGLVTVSIHDAKGKHPVRNSQANLNAGDWTFHPGALSQGLYFLRLETPESKATVRFPVLETPVAGPIVPGFAVAAAWGPRILAKAAVTAIDSLRFTKAGYQARTEPLLSLNQTGMVAQLSDSASSQSALTAISLDDVPLQPAFQSGHLTYTATVRDSVQSLAFTFSTGIAEPKVNLVANGIALASFQSPIPLNLGMNTLLIQSVSQDSSSSRTYTISIHRVRDTASVLSSLTVPGMDFSPPFQPGVFNYKLSVLFGTVSTTLWADWNEPLATVKLITPLGTYPLSRGQASPLLQMGADSTRTLVEVLSPDGQHTSTYALDFILQPPPPPPNFGTGLASVKVVPGATIFPAWSSSITRYRLTVMDTATALQITYTPNSPGAFIKAGTADWHAGALTESLPFKGSPDYFNRPILVRNGTDTTAYQFTIETGLSKDATLRRIVVSPIGTGATNTSQNVYNVVFASLDSVVTVKPVAQNEFAKITYDGKVVPIGGEIRLSLIPGDNLFSLYVTSQEGSITKRIPLEFGRLKPKTPESIPAISGPAAGYVGLSYSYIYTTPKEACLSGMTSIARIEWGDGTKSTYGDRFPSGNLPWGTHIWNTPGTHVVKAIAYCSNDFINLPADTSAPITVQISDPASGGKMRAITGSRFNSETWSPDTLYQITGNTIFDAAATLTILPGTKVLFANAALTLGIYGGLSAIGTASDSVVFEGGGALQVRWQGPLSYNPDGSYKAGPRLEYVNFRGVTKLFVRFIVDVGGGYGPYVRNSNIPIFTGDTFYYARGSYFEKCRIGNIEGMRLYNSRIINSYIANASLRADIPYPMTINKCDIKSMSFNAYDFTQTPITGNTIRKLVGGGSSKVTLHGNNLLASGAELFRSTGPMAYDLQDNFWGEAATAEMTAKGPNQNVGCLWDYYDDLNLGKADYSNWKTTLIPDAKPDW
ncbi:MAG: cadherin-like beta sandwich domain-containing protein [Fibrobacteria bacterium]